MPVTTLIRRREEWHAPLNGGRHRVNLNGSAPDRPQRTLTEGLIAGWHSALMSNGPALQWLLERRGLEPNTLEQYEIGLDGRLYTIPVHGPGREIWNVRFYDPRATPGRRKIWSESGYGSPNRLYPISILLGDPEEIIIEEGEWDCLLSLQHFYAAVTRTGAADVWDAAWGEYFKGRIVYLGHDCDEKGQAANRKVALALRHIADVRRLVLPYEIVPKHGSDITDLIMDHGPQALRALMDEAKPFFKAKQTSTLQTVTILDTADATAVGKPVQLVATIKGRKEPGYTIPRRILLTCSRDAGLKCTICPMNAAAGEAEVEVTPDDPLVLEMIDASSSAVGVAVAGAYGVPGGKCVKLQQEVQEHQSVEILFARPALDFSEVADAEHVPPDSPVYKTIKLTSVGRHDTPPNNTVRVIGALQPNPRTQSNEFLVHELELMETAVDRFELNDESIRLMQRFQAHSRPLTKLAEINKSLAEHVTRIHGRPEMHAVMDLTWHSILSFKFAGELVERGWLEALIVGDTRTGKSLAAARLARHFGGGEVIGCEAASFAGVVGGLQQLGGKDWAVTWGVVPLNDKRLVVLDEISGLTPEEISQMSDIRSSGQAKLIKIQQEATWARARLLWLGNPRNATMANYTYGVDAIKPLIGNAEDIARFDLAMSLSMFDVASEVINKPSGGGELVYTREACHALLMWCWTRTADQVKFTYEAEEKVFDLANEMGKLYIEDPPLIQAANVRIKIARVAVAIAARTFSTDQTKQMVVVTPAYVDAAVRFINLLYGMDSFGYRERSREQLADRLLAHQNKGNIEQYLKSRPTLAKFLRGTGKFRRQDLDEILNVSREESNGIISTLYEARMVSKRLGDIIVEPTLHGLLREVRW
jgi:hypothetical protein